MLQWARLCFFSCRESSCCSRNLSDVNLADSASGEISDQCASTKPIHEEAVKSEAEEWKEWEEEMRQAN